MISDEQLRTCVHWLKLSCQPRLTHIKKQNDVYRIDCDSDVFFLKTYTKDWYGSDIARTGLNAHHEATAWTILAQHGLAAAEVVYVATSCDTPLARPFILTRQLGGTPFTTLLTSNHHQRHTLLSTVGSYLQQMHRITFTFPGYLTTLSGPTTPLDPQQWQHRCWSARHRQEGTLAYLVQQQEHLSLATFREVFAACSQMADRLAGAYQPPRFTHGDCHAHQFFLAESDRAWHVTGVVDMEVTSAGDCGEDLLKLSIELAQSLAYTTRWWEALFEGYGLIPDFELFRLRLLSATEPEFGTCGRWIGTATWEAMLRHFLHATDWDTLFAPVA